jgi:hypothetical protein
MAEEKKKASRYPKIVSHLVYIILKINSVESPRITQDTDQLLTTATKREHKYVNTVMQYTVTCNIALFGF